MIKGWQVLGPIELIFLVKWHCWVISSKHVIFLSVFTTCALAFIPNTRSILTAWWTSSRWCMSIHFTIIWVTWSFLSLLNHSILFYQSGSSYVAKFWKKAIITCTIINGTFLFDWSFNRWFFRRNNHFGVIHYIGKSSTRSLETDIRLVHWP